MAKLTHAALVGNASKVEALKQIHHAVSSSANGLTKSVQDSYNLIKPVIDEGSEALAQQVGVEAGTVQVAIAFLAALFVGLTSYGFVYIPVKRNLSKRRQTQLLVAFEIMEERRRRNIEQACAIQMAHEQSQIQDTRLGRPTV